MTSPTTVFHAPTIRGGALVIHREGAQRVCRTCRKSKPIDAFRMSQPFYHRLDCRPCESARRCMHFLITAEEKTQRSEERWEEEYQRVIQRTEGLVWTDRPIPPSDPSLDLAVIAACWRQCVAAGSPAIRRMLKKIVDSCIGVHGSFHLRGAAQDYLAGIGDLALVQRALEECVGLAVAS